MGGMSCIVVAHHQVINAFRLLLESRTQRDFEDVLKAPMPNCAMFWYQRRTAEGRLTTRVETCKKIVVIGDGARATEESYTISRRMLSNEELFTEVRMVKPIE